MLWNIFRVNNKSTRTTSTPPENIRKPLVFSLVNLWFSDVFRGYTHRFGVFIVNFGHISHLFPSMFIAIFKQGNVSWVICLHEKYYFSKAFFISICDKSRKSRRLVGHFHIGPFHSGPCQTSKMELFSQMHPSQMFDRVLDRPPLRVKGENEMVCVLSDCFLGTNRIL